jgi:internalin A
MQDEQDRIEPKDMTPEQAHAEAVRRIDAAAESGQYWLDLGDLPIEVIPLEIQRLSSTLTHLALGLSSFEFIPNRILLMRDRMLIKRQLHDLSPLAGLDALQSLDLTLCQQIIDLSPLTGLGALQSLNLSGCTRITNFSPLVGLSALQLLDLFSCVFITDISSFAELETLQSLDLHLCLNVRDLTPLAHLYQLESLNIISTYAAAKLCPEHVLVHHPCLQRFYAYELHATPPEVLSKSIGDNCLPRLRSWWHDLQQGEAESHEVKLFILGNGRVGKTQLFRRLRGEAFVPDQPSTHGIQLGRFELCTHDDGRPIFLNVWDFGGQDIYLGTHALFLQSRAIFVLAWHPEHESDAPYTEAMSGLPMRHRPLRYWLDYIHSLAGSDTPLIVVQTRCEREHDVSTPVLADRERFGWLKTAVSCARRDDGVDELRGLLKRAARYRMEQQAPPRLPASWLRVRDRLATMRTTHKSIDLQTFDDVCTDTQGSAVPSALLHYLHQAGDVLYRKDLFQDGIVLDQQWALDAIYSLFQREGLLPLLHRQGGMFAPALLGFAGWDGRYTEAEQALLRSMMESCHLIFPVHRWNDGDALYAMPDALPLRAEVSGQLEAVWPEAAIDAQATLHYRFLHDGILRRFLSDIGRLAGPHALYWRYGVCFHDANTRSRARVDAMLDADGPGKITIETRGPGASELCQQLVKKFEEIRIGEAPQIERDDNAPATLPQRMPEDTETPAIVPAPIPLSPQQKPIVYLSYARGGKDRPELKAFAIELQRSLEADFDVRRDDGATRSGDRISEFMREIGRGARVLVLLSDPYLRSPYCMRELLHLYHRHLENAQELQKHVLPLVLDADLTSSAKQRLVYVKFWKQHLAELKVEAAGLDPVECLPTHHEMAMIEEFRLKTEDMLIFLDDILMPRGMPYISENDFYAVKMALRRLGDIKHA